MTDVAAPVSSKKRRPYKRDLCLFGILAAAIAVPLSSFVSSLIYRDQKGTWFEFRQDQALSEAVMLDNLRIQPLGAGKVKLRINYSQLKRDKAFNKTSLCIHVVPEAPTNVPSQHRERGYLHLDFTPDPPLGSWASTFYREQILGFSDLTNQKAAVRLATWSPETQSGTQMFSYAYDFAEFDRGYESTYADHIASPHKREFAIYLTTTFGLLALIMILCRSRKPR